MYVYIFNSFLATSKTTGYHNGPPQNCYHKHTICACSDSNTPPKPNRKYREKTTPLYPNIPGTIVLSMLNCILGSPRTPPIQSQSPNMYCMIMPREQGILYDKNLYVYHFIRLCYIVFGTNKTTNDLIVFTSSSFRPHTNYKIIYSGQAGSS